LTTTLAAGVALMAFANAANAKGNHRHGNSQYNGVSPHFVISGQPASAKRDRKAKKEKLAEKKQKGCEKIIVPTAGCAISPKDPVGSVPPTFNSGNSGAKGPSPAFTTVTLSNGVNKSAIFNGKGLTVTSNSPGTLTVSNGTSSVTMPGGSLTLHGALSVSVPAGYQLVRLTNGDFSVAVSPVLASGPAQSRPVPPGVGAIDVAKGLGNFYNSFGSVPAVVGPVVAATPMAAVITGLAGENPVKEAGQFLGEVSEQAINWATSWF
jgi:hypothetical protein